MTEVILDAHAHIWDLEVTPQPWIEPAAAPVLERSFSLEELEAAARPAGVTSAILVQSVNEATETQRLLLGAEDDPFVAGVIGWTDFTDSESEKVIEQLLTGPGGSHLRGFRHVFSSGEADQWMQAGSVNATLRTLARQNLSFDLLLSVEELPLALWLARRHPEVTFILDHLAKPDVRSGLLEPWRGHIDALSQAPNVYAKFSGLPAEANWTAWSATTIAPYFEAALHAFTPDRLIFATDWPVCTVAGTYQTVVEAQTSLCQQLSPAELELVVRGNARDAYRLDSGDTRRG